MKAQLQSILKVVKPAGHLKFELRHSYTSSGRQESVAEQTWRMALMAGNISVAIPSCSLNTGWVSSCH